MKEKKNELKLVINASLAWEYDFVPVFLLLLLLLFFSFFVTNKVVQDWIKIIDLESCIETEMIVIFFCGVRMTFLS